jgi:hypothetical protein
VTRGSAAFLVFFALLVLQVGLKIRSLKGRLRVTCQSID